MAAAGAERIGRSPWFFPVAGAGLAACLALGWLLDAGGPWNVLAVNRAGRIVWLVLWLELWARILIEGSMSPDTSLLDIH